MIDRIYVKSKNEVVIIYFDKPPVTIYSDNGTALYYTFEIFNLDKELPCTTLKIV